MKKKDFKGSSIEELKKSLIEIRKDLFDQNVDKQMGKLKNSKSINIKKKEIARIMTEIRNKELQNAG